jgi:hypothetical protein
MPYINASFRRLDPSHGWRDGKGNILKERMYNAKDTEMCRRMSATDHRRYSEMYLHVWKEVTIYINKLFMSL